jgi:hypothetical protein
MFTKYLSLLLSLTAITVLTSATSANAGTMTAEWENLPSNSYRVADSAINTQPVPGKVTTSAAALKTAPSTDVAQIPPIVPGRATRSGSSYIGVAGNIGLGGDSTALGRGNFAVISKIGLTREFSVRPAAVIGSDTTILLPLTYDFNLKPVELTPARFAPYVGAGVAFSTSGSDAVGLLLTGGVDVPLTSDFTATAGLNAAFRDKTDVGLLVGVGYNFSGF